MDEDDKNSTSFFKNTIELFQLIDGRKYQNGNKPVYLLPMDNIEAERLNKLHNIVRYIFKGDFSSPLKESMKSGGIKTLDIGCGSGSWIVDLSTENTLSTFIGIDMVPIFPKNCPPNSAFLQCNVLHGIPFPDNTFDFVHQQGLRLAFTRKNWKTTIDDILRVTKPGGWVEFCEIDSYVRSTGSNMKKLTNA
ncbi:10698_t:CDS:2, partial [Ambispora leptoticha]